MSIYSQDPDTGLPRAAGRRTPLTCRGCRGPIEDGQAIMVTVTRARHIITVPAHAEHYEAARANTLENASWQRDQSHYAG